jgi:molecular chaperone HtpG
MIQEKGNVSVRTENIFPIIRKWLYSDHDIFLRELVSNAADALSKMKRISTLGEAEVPEGTAWRIDVIEDKEKGTLSISDNGIGMTADEVRKYINQIAFSGAVDFVEKYKDSTADSAGIIGHFGLGFYSAFMVSDKVRIDTLSFEAGAESVSWESENGTEYELGASDRTERGTTVTLFLSEDGKSLLEPGKARSVLEKYCAFMPYPIHLDNADSPVNDTAPLWLKNPKDCTDEEYREFYRKAFSDYREPLFWIHLNMDYPFSLKGILYFPQQENVYETLDGRIKLYYNQVFVADNIKEVIPEFLFLLKGCIDCPDLPLNVSRSFLQNDGYVQKLSAHIIRKVSDKLTTLFESSRSEYEGFWPDIGPFVKYGCLREEKFYDRMKDALLFKRTEGGFTTLAAYLEDNKEKAPDKVWYTVDAAKQGSYLKMAASRGIGVVVMDHELDNSFMSFLEYKQGKVHFQRIDSELTGEAASKETVDRLSKLFRDASGDAKLDVQVRSLGTDGLPAMLSESEQSRRMQEMRKQFEQQRRRSSAKAKKDAAAAGGVEGADGADDAQDPFEDGKIDELFPLERQLVLNHESSLVKRLETLTSTPEHLEEASEVAMHLYDLARLGHGSLSAEAMHAFLERSVRMLEKAAEGLGQE